MTSPLLVIADDDAHMRSLVRDTLHPEYPDAIELPDGRALFWQLMRASFGVNARDLVVVTDIRMPTYSGLEVLDAWRAQGDHVPIVVITAFPDEKIRGRVGVLDATLLAKPFTRAQLRLAVREAVRRAKGAAA